MRLDRCAPGDSEARRDEKCRGAAPRAEPAPRDTALRGTGGCAPVSRTGANGSQGIMKQCAEAEHGKHALSAPCADLARTLVIEKAPLRSMAAVVRMVRDIKDLLCPPLRNAAGVRAEWLAWVKRELCWTDLWLRNSGSGAETQSDATPCRVMRR